MSEELFNWKKVSFTDYLNKDGRIIKTLGFNLVGEVLILNINPIEYGSDKIALSVVPMVNCTSFLLIP